MCRTFMLLTWAILPLLLACELKGQHSEEPNTKRIKKIPTKSTYPLHSMIKPDLDHSRWRMIPWATDISEAQKMAAAQDKPLLIFAAADGHPIARL